MTRITKRTMIGMLAGNGVAIDRYYKELKSVIGLEDDYSIWATDRLIMHLEMLEVEAAFLELGILNDHYQELASTFPSIRGMN